MRELAFHRGKATARPTSLIAKTVRVLATAHNAPANRAHTMRCFFSARSAKTYPVPLSSVGKVHRAVKTPATMQSETADHAESMERQVLRTYFLNHCCHSSFPVSDLRYALCKAISRAIPAMST